MAIIIVLTDWVAKVKKSWENDPTVQQLISSLQADPDSKPGYTWNGEQLLYKG